MHSKVYECTNRSRSPLTVQSALLQALAALDRGKTPSCNYRVVVTEEKRFLVHLGRFLDYAPGIA